MHRCISLCLIAKNAEATITTSLRSTTNLVVEMVVVDTGSTDGTKEIAASLGARVFDFAWVDSFAAARNESLRHATGDWIFWLDADESLDDDNRAKLKALFDQPGDEPAGYVRDFPGIPGIQYGPGIPRNRMPYTDNYEFVSFHSFNSLFYRRVFGDMEATVSWHSFPDVSGLVKGADSPSFPGRAKTSRLLP